MTRKTKDVLQSLIEARLDLVKTYPPGVEQTTNSVAGLLPKVAAFPVGTGLADDPWPEFFPDRPVLFVGHNWGNDRMLQAAWREGGEGHTTFWVRLRDFLKASGVLEPRQIHVTNLLQGIKAGPAAGTMSKDPIFLGECIEYLRAQISIAKPRCVIVLGDDCRRLCPGHSKIMHPSTRAVNWGGTYEEWVQRQGAEILAALQKK